MTLGATFEQCVSELIGHSPPVKIGVAVSGGGDSIALLHLLAKWAAATQSKLHAVTVDHGLRPESASEAKDVANHCAKLGVSHAILTWSGWDGAGNLQDQARRARYRLMANWADEHHISHIALGHTLNDQAETVLMRLARGSGVDGLSAMVGARRADGITWIRPLLKLERANLRTYLKDQGLGWAQDPSNEDQKFDRIKMRAAMKTLSDLGISQQGLADTASRLGDARRVLELVAQTEARDIVNVNMGSVSVDLKGFFELWTETARRILIHCLCWVSGGSYPPRNVAVVALTDAMAQGTTSTLHGCLISPSEDKCTIGREHAAVAGITTPIDAKWDNRWKLFGPAQDDLHISATGENGLKLCPDWRESGLDRQVLLSAPAVWRGGELVAAPLAGFGAGWRAEFLHDENHFFTTVLSH